MDRAHKRKVRRELEEYNKRVDEILGNFYKHLFGYDWDNGDGGFYIGDRYYDDIFEAYRDAWLNFCRDWNKHKREVVADERFFYEKMMKQ